MEENRNDYERLIAPIESKMMQTVWRVLGDPDDTEEALQDALVNVWKKIDRIRGAQNPHALILKICADSAYDRLRKKIRDRNRHQDVQAETESSEPTPLRQAESSETRSQILNAIGSLPRNQAIAVMMRIIQEESYSTIAAALNCGEATARKHVNRGRARLRECVVDLSSTGSANQGRTDD